MSHQYGETEIVSPASGSLKYVPMPTSPAGVYNIGFNELNPQRDVAVFTLGARAGRAKVATRVRLATSQRLVAVAQMSDGTYWQHAVDVIVTLAACVES